MVSSRQRTCQPLFKEGDEDAKVHPAKEELVEKLVSLIVPTDPYQTADEVPNA